MRARPPPCADADTGIRMRVFGAAATRERLPFAALTAALAAAVARLAAGAIAAPERLVLPLAGGARYLVMPAADAQLAVTKLITVHPGNAARGLPAIRGSVIVADAASGEPLMVLDGPAVTARRTAALTLLGLRTLRPGPLGRAVLVGTGAQAREHALALHETFGALLDVVGRDLGRAAALCAGLAALGIDARPPLDRDAATAAVFERADAIVTLTASLTPVLPEALPAAALIVAVGAWTPRMAEVPPAVVQARQVGVDTLAGARHEAGDLLQAGVDWSRVRPLADCLGHAAPAGPVLFKTVGHAAWDLAAARVALGLEA